MHQDTDKHHHEEQPGETLTIEQNVENTGLFTFLNLKSHSIDMTPEKRHMLILYIQIQLGETLLTHSENREAEFQFFVLLIPSLPSIWHTTGRSHS